MSHLIDTHVHLDFLPAAEMAEARAAGVGGFVVPGVVPAGWPALLALAEGHADVWCAPGLHPLHAAEWSPVVAQELERLLHSPRTVALGEIGLDANSPAAPEVQEAALRGQLRLAVAAGKPVLLHCRRATDRLFRLLDQEGIAAVGGILHAFSGSLETAMAALRRNLVLGCGGVLTWPEARRTAAALQALPAEALVLESDAPDLAPHPYRGTENHPAWLPLIARRVGELRGWSLEETAEITTRNAQRVLGALGTT